MLEEKKRKLVNQKLIIGRSAQSAAPPLYFLTHYLTFLGNAKKNLLIKRKTRETKVEPAKANRSKDKKTKRAKPTALPVF